MSNAAYRQEDELTKKLGEILHSCDVLQNYIDAGTYLILV